MDNIEIEIQIEMFESIITEIISVGATRDQAIAWLRSQCPYYGDIGFMEYDYGLPRGYLKR